MGAPPDQKTDLKAVPADSDCDGPHLTGTIGGVAAPAGPCGWGRLLAFSHSPRILVDMAHAVTEEERALVRLTAEPPNASHWELLLYGSLGIEHTLEELDKAEKAGNIGAGAAAKIRRRLDSAKAIDDELKKRLQADKTPDAAGLKSVTHEIRNALDLKRGALAQLEAVFLQALSISPIGAEFVEDDRATTYTVPTVDDQPGSKITYHWTVTLQAVDPSVGIDTACNNHGALKGTGSKFVWHHGNAGDPIHDDGCDHTKQGKYGHQGLISVVVTDDHGWKCTATYKGTSSSDAKSVQNGVASAPACAKA
jgi:hypothetical protein